MDNLEKIEKINYAISCILQENNQNDDSYQYFHPISMLEKISENLFDLLNEFNHEKEIDYTESIEIINESLLNFMYILNWIYNEMEEDKYQCNYKDNDEKKIVSINIKKDEK